MVNTWSWVYNTTDSTTAPITVTITATDKAGLTATTTFTLTILNVPPTITSFAAAEIIVGNPVTLSATATDPAGPVSFRWDVQSAHPGSPVNSYSGASVQVPVDGNDSYSVTLNAMSVDGSTAQERATMSVTNVPPTITSFSVPANLVEGRYLSVTATNPAGTLDPLTYSWALRSPGGQLLLATGGVSPLFYLGDSGSFIVNVTVSDGDGETTEADRDGPRRQRQVRRREPLRKGQPSCAANGSPPAIVPRRRHG